MKQFYELLATHGYPIPSDDQESFVILSATSTTEGYVLVTRRTWEDKSVREDAWLIIEEPYGPRKGELRVGWSHKILEHYVEVEEEKPMRAWGPNHPQYKAEFDWAYAPDDWNGDQVVFRDGRDYPQHLKGKSFVKWNWKHTGDGCDIVGYPSD